MKPLKRRLVFALSALQVVIFGLPFVLNYYGSHRMGAHRHLKVRADQYFSGILCNRNLTIAAVIVSVLLVLLIWYLVSQKQSLRRNRLRATWVSLGLTVVLLALLVIPSARAILIYPWLLLCAVMLWLFQLAKMWLVNDHIRKNEQ